MWVVDFWGFFLISILLMFVLLCVCMFVFEFCLFFCILDGFIVVFDYECVMLWL